METHTWQREADESSSALTLRYVICGHRLKHLTAESSVRQIWLETATHLLHNISSHILIKNYDRTAFWANHSQSHSIIFETISQFSTIKKESFFKRRFKDVPQQLRFSFVKHLSFWLDSFRSDVTILTSQPFLIMQPANRSVTNTKVLKYVLHTFIWLKKPQPDADRNWQEERKISRTIKSLVLRNSMIKNIKCSKCTIMLLFSEYYLSCSGYNNCLWT